MIVSTTGSGPRIAFLHGFTQTSASWRAVAERFAERWTVVHVDLPGHGTAGELRATLDEAADLLAAEVGAAAWVGYSLGARHALHVALRHPAIVERLVLLGGTAGIDDPGERAARRASDEELAVSLERDGVAAFLERWLANPMFAGLPRHAAGLAERRANTSAGLAASLRLAGTGTQQPSWDTLAELRMPVLVAAGEEDVKFSALGRRMTRAIGPNAQFAAIAGAGHAAHLEQPDAFVALLEEFLSRTAPARD